jgi:hypothetical protein
MITAYFTADVHTHTNTRTMTEHHINKQLLSAEFHQLTKVLFPTGHQQSAPEESNPTNHIRKRPDGLICMRATSVLLGVKHGFIKKKYIKEYCPNYISVFGIIHSIIQIMSHVSATKPIFSVSRIHNPFTITHI